MGPALGYELAVIIQDGLRRFFEVNRYHVVLAALKALPDDGKIETTQVMEAISKYRIEPEAPNPVVS
uniref:Pyruvate dehydrogenase E1 component n=1 Tax=Candidatus Kentrum sp. FW TaxID=2126338 RepID=A0A450TSB1_9GAMM|nr:MAG: pyruvate dehydrogenase E1 component [Candidatus Kentron sp. FW]